MPRASSKCAACRRYRTRSEAPEFCRRNCWMAYAINPAHKGELHRALGIPLGSRIPDVRLVECKSDARLSLATRRRCNLALVLRGYRKKPKAASTQKKTHGGRPRISHK